MNIDSNKQEWCKIKLEKGEGKAIPLNLRPILFKSTIQLPCFDITILTADGIKTELKTEPKTVKCTWIGQTKLIGSSYEKFYIILKNIYWIIVLLVVYYFQELAELENPEFCLKLLEKV